MKKTFKKYITAHKDNDYNPHILQEASIVVLLLVVFALFGLYIFAPNLIFVNKSGAAIYSSMLVDLTNRERAQNGEQPLEISTRLTKAAELKAQDMANKGYFAHNSPQGVTPWYWFGKADYAFKYAGENLAIDFNNSDEVVTAWMNSPKHRANILNGKFTQMGIAFVQGSWEGRSTVFVVQMFGTPEIGVPALATASNNEPQPYAIETSSPTQPVVLTPQVQGAAVEDPKPHVEVLTETPTFIAVQSASAERPEAIRPATTALQTPPQTQPISTSEFLGRFILKPSHILEAVYVVIAALVLIALCFALFIEQKNRHVAHIIYGWMVVFTIILLLAVSQTYFSPYVLIK